MGLYTASMKRVREIAKRREGQSMHTLLAERLAQAERRRALWPTLWQAIGRCCECLVWFLVILIGHVLLIRLWLGR